MNAVLPFIQTAAGVGLVAYAAVHLLTRLRIARPWGRSQRAPVDDLRLVIDLAARLRDAGRTNAVKVCQALLDELLKPTEQKP